MFKLQFPDANSFFVKCFSDNNNRALTSSKDGDVTMCEGLHPDLVFVVDVDEYVLV